LCPGTILVTDGGGGPIDITGKAIDMQCAGKKETCILNGAGSTNGIILADSGANANFTGINFINCNNDGLVSSSRSIIRLQLNVLSYIDLLVWLYQLLHTLSFLSLFNTQVGGLVYAKNSTMNFEHCTFSNGSAFVSSWSASKSYSYINKYLI
jgi:hypothetical protein